MIGESAVRHAEAGNEPLTLQVCGMRLNQEAPERFIMRADDNWQHN